MTSAQEESKKKSHPAVWILILYSLSIGGSFNDCDFFCVTTPFESWRRVHRMCELLSLPAKKRRTKAVGAPPVFLLQSWVRFPVRRKSYWWTKPPCSGVRFKSWRWPALNCCWPFYQSLKRSQSISAWLLQWSFLHVSVTFRTEPLIQDQKKL